MPSRSDGRVGVLGCCKKLEVQSDFKDPHPGSLSLADPPRKGEGEESGLESVKKNQQVGRT